MVAWLVGQLINGSCPLGSPHGGRSSLVFVSSVIVIRPLGADVEPDGPRSPGAVAPADGGLGDGVPDTLVDGRGWPGTSWCRPPPAPVATPYAAAGTTSATAVTTPSTVSL